MSWGRVPSSAFNIMMVGDLVKHKHFEQYGIILDILKPEVGNGAYFIVLWAGKTITDWVWDDMVERA